MSDRKYRQRGYRDGDRDRGPRGPRGPRPPRPPGPRGRGLGKPTETVFRCAVCGKKQLEGVEVKVDSTCWKCGADLHTCTHCRHFAPGIPKECRQPLADYVPAKAKRNDCGYFEPKLAQEFGGEPDNPTDAKAAFDALFKL